MWDVLGIAPTTDRTEIRRAYAKRLRLIDSDRDPASFMRLRAAYDAALAWLPAVDTICFDDDPVDADTADVPQTGDLAADDLAALDGASTHVEAPSAPAETDEPTLADFRDALAEKRTLDAWRRLDGLMARGIIGIGSERPWMNRLADLGLHDLDLPVGTFAELAARLGYTAPVAGDDPDLRRRIGERLAAERWVSALRDRSAEVAWGYQREDVLIARLFLGQSRAKRLTGQSRMRRLPGVKSGRLRQYLEVYRQHRPWIGRAMDPARLAAVEAGLDRATQRRLRRKKRRDTLWMTYAGIVIVLLIIDFIWILVTGGAKGH